MSKRVVIGVDQSYTRTGISICADGRFMSIKSQDFTILGPSASRTAKRDLISNCIYVACNMAFQRCSDVMIICERIRLRSQGVISEDYIKSTAALIGRIVDTADRCGVKVYSVDTRAWKAAVVGTCKSQENKYGIDPHKYPTIRYMERNGLLKHILIPYDGRGKKGVITIKGKRYLIDDDAADAACMALYGFLPGPLKLQLEE